VFADPVVATAILDRPLHHSHVLTMCQIPRPVESPGAHGPGAFAVFGRRYSSFGERGLSRKAGDDRNFRASSLLR
jgi:hypothetical protein